MWGFNISMAEQHDKLLNKVKELQAENASLRALLKETIKDNERYEKEAVIKGAGLLQKTQELKEYDDFAAEYGIDGKAMLILAKSQIATAKSNCELQAELDRYKTAEKLGRLLPYEFSCLESKDKTTLYIAHPFEIKVVGIIRADLIAKAALKEGESK